MSPLLLAVLLLAGPVAADERADADARRFDGSLGRAGDASAAQSVVNAARAWRPTGANPPLMTPAPRRDDSKLNRVAQPPLALALGGTFAPEQVPPWVDSLRRLYTRAAGAFDIASPLPIADRAAWNRRTPKHKPEAMRPTRMTAHHTSDPAPADPDFDATFEAVRDIQANHRRRGYDDIGYNFIIDAAGRVVEGRGAAVLGAHSGPHANDGNVGISLIGNFEETTPPPEQERAFIRLGGYLVVAYGMSTSDDAFLLGHRDNKGAATACPGKNVMLVLGAWRTLIRAQAKALFLTAANAGAAKFTPILVTYGR